jgi:hypothetical protein
MVVAADVVACVQTWRKLGNNGSGWQARQLS